MDRKARIVSFKTFKVHDLEIFLVDAIGPFFRGYKKRRINWSKIPFHHLRIDQKGCRRQFDRIARDMDTFAAKVSMVGFNSVSLDDVAHLAPDEWYEPEINKRVQILQREYRALFAILKQYNLDIYLTMDILSYTSGLKDRIAGCRKKGTLFLVRQIETVLTSFPEIKGIIIRIGECDGKDVKGDFKSELFFKTPAQVNSMLHAILPVFEQHQRMLILRNWTVGAYRIGDFIWNRRTTAQVLKGIDSPCFILSMKYGESDFFRYLPLNKHFFRFNVKKIIELQTRREYEGSGEYPSFIGWDYQEYAMQLKAAKNMVGISVWCQTGGWLPFRRLTYLEKGGIWNELNSYVTLKVFKDGVSVEEAVFSYCSEINCSDPASFLELLKLDDEVIKELLYIREIAEQKLFFRRVRIPPLMTVFWNNIFINHSVRKVLLFLVRSPEDCVKAGFDALDKIERMKAIAEYLHLPAEDFEYMADTFFILALARKYYFLPYSENIREEIKNAKLRYKQIYPRDSRYRYRIKTNFTPFPISLRHLRIFLRLLLRNKRGYRIVDHLFTLHLLGILYRLFVIIRPKSIPEFARKHAMGIGTIFR